MARRLLLVLLLCVLPFFIFTHLASNAIRSPQSSTLHPLSVPADGPYAPANSTLGFGAIVAVSRPGSPRRTSLLYAANLTDLDIVIPTQPVWSDQDVENFKAVNQSKISHGSALAWLGHLNALRWFLKSDLSTALIIEDDIDWDVHLRTSQLPIVASRMRELTARNAPSGAHPPPSANEAYWGRLADWEIIYLGHCGDFFEKDRFSSLPHLIFSDPSLPSFDRLHTKTSSFLSQLSMGESQRMVHRSYWPLCTFAYAVSRASAARILREFAREQEDKGTHAYDVRILEACRDLDWMCYSSNPELFHHMEAPSEIASVNKGIVDDYGRLQRSGNEGTPNIACGARSESLLTTDLDTFRWLKSKISEEGRCLVDQVKEDMGRWP